MSKRSFPFWDGDTQTRHYQVKWEAIKVAAKTAIPSHGPSLSKPYSVIDVSVKINDTFILYSTCRGVCVLEGGGLGGIETNHPNSYPKAVVGGGDVAYRESPKCFPVLTDVPPSHRHYKLCLCWPPNWIIGYMSKIIRNWWLLMLKKWSLQFCMHLIRNNLIHSFITLGTALKLCVIL